FADMLCKVDDDLLKHAEQLVCGVDEPSTHSEQYQRLYFKIQTSHQHQKGPND
ncbi:hypothetical protein M9458_052017, partial [Cirrhinus mrigala]